MVNIFKDKKQGYRKAFEDYLNKLGDKKKDEFLLDKWTYLLIWLSDDFTEAANEIDMLHTLMKEELLARAISEQFSDHDNVFSSLRQVNVYIVQFPFANRIDSYFYKRLYKLFNDLFETIPEDELEKQFNNILNLKTERDRNNSINAFFIGLFQNKKHDLFKKLLNDKRISKQFILNDIVLTLIARLPGLPIDEARKNLETLLEIIDEAVLSEIINNGYGASKINHFVKTLKKLNLTENLIYKQMVKALPAHEAGDARLAALARNRDFNPVNDDVGRGGASARPKKTSMNDERGRAPEEMFRKFPNPPEFFPVDSSAEEYKAEDATSFTCWGLRVGVTAGVVFLTLCAVKPVLALIILKGVYSASTAAPSVATGLVGGSGLCAATLFGGAVDAARYRRYKSSDLLAQTFRPI